ERMNTEDIFYWLVSALINLFVFTFLAYILLLKVDVKIESSPINLFIENPAVEKVKFSRAKGMEIKPKLGKHTIEKGKEGASTTPMVLERREGDVSLPAGKTTQEDVSILSEIERRVKGRKDSQEEGTPTKNIGEVSAVISNGSVGFGGGSGRGILYVPALPKFAAEELPSTLRVRVWVEPSGIVSRVEILQRSGVPQIDERLVEFVRRIKFEPIKENLIQTGILIFRFKGG
ncbi:MAG: energy transducer TonB, partial [Aquificaceae bacterium]